MKDKQTTVALFKFLLITKSLQKAEPGNTKINLQGYFFCVSKLLQTRTLGFGCLWDHLHVKLQLFQIRFTVGTNGISNKHDATQMETTKNNT